MEEQTDYLLQNKITSKEIVMETLLKRFEQLTTEMKNLSQQIQNATIELDTLTNPSENPPSDQDIVTQNSFFNTPEPLELQPDSHEDVE